MALYPNSKATPGYCFEWDGWGGRETRSLQSFQVLEQKHWLGVWPWPVREAASIYSHGEMMICRLTECQRCPFVWECTWTDKKHKSLCKLKILSYWQRQKTYKRKECTQPLSISCPTRKVCPVISCFSLSHSDLGFVHPVSCISIFSVVFWPCAHTPQFGSAQLNLVQCRQSVGSSLCTERVRSHGKGARVCVREDVCVCSRQAHWCPPAFPAEIQRVWQVCEVLCSVLGNDGRTPPHHWQVVCAHWPLLG